MPDLAETDETPHRFDHVVRGFPPRLVDDEDSVNGWWRGSPGMAFSRFPFGEFPFRTSSCSS